MNDCVPSRIASRSSRGYDRLSRWYLPLERILFNHRLMRARAALLSKLDHCDHALFLGDGDGRLLAEFCQQQPTCQTLSVDQSQRMLDLQREAIDQEITPNVSFMHAEALEFQPAPANYDLIVAACFLDCFPTETLQRKMPVWLSGLKPNGHFYFVDFVSPPSGIHGISGRTKLWLMHRFFAAATGLSNRQLPDWSTIFDDLPLEVIERQQSSCRLIESRLYRRVSIV